MTKNFYEAIEGRRSHYGISKDEVVSDDKIKEIIEHAVKHTPSAFNSQTARVVLLLDNHHTKLWDITKEALRKIVPEEKFSPTEEKINMFSEQQISYLKEGLDEKIGILLDEQSFEIELFVGFKTKLRIKWK